MKKAFILFLIFAVVGLTLGSCVNEVITYCPFCGKANLKEVSEYDTNTGITTIYYKCQNSDCGRTFGAGRIKDGDKE